MYRCFNAQTRAVVDTGIGSGGDGDDCCGCDVSKYFRTRWERMDREMGSASSPDASDYRASEGLTDHHICERSSTVGWPHH